VEGEIDDDVKTTVSRSAKYQEGRNEIGAWERGGEGC